jgi:Na+:H+ antiporter
LINTIYDIAFLIAIALILARIFGFLFSKINFPVVIGEILAGFVLGGLGVFIFTGDIIPLFGTSVNIPCLDYLSFEFDFLAEIGVLFLMFISGLSTNISQLKTMGKTSTYVAFGGIIVPLFLGIIISLLFGYNNSDSIVIGLILIATSVGITVRTLMDLHMLDTKAGTTILGGAVIDDVLGIILLSFVVGTDPILYIGIKVIFFFIIFLYFGLKVIDKLLTLSEKINLPKAFLSISLSIFLLYSFFADRFGISGVIGAFIAGLLIGHSIKSRKIIDDVQALGYGFFVPLFFIWVGARLFIGIITDVTSLIEIGIFSILIVFVGIVGKIIGCGIGSHLAGMTKKESLQVGIGMIPRMELALIIVSAAIANNFLSSAKVENQFLAITVILTIVTTLITPFLIKRVFR